MLRPRLVTFCLVAMWLANASVHAAPPPARPAPLDAAAAGRFANLALRCVHQEYPNKVAHVLASDADALPPRTLYPAFHGCYDWHSAVHAHWLLARLAKRFPDAAFATDARAALARSLTVRNLAAEVAYLQRQDRLSFERPYGLAWLLALGAELRTWDDPRAREWAQALGPIEAQAVANLTRWLPDLTYAIRVGEHDQTAFAFGLIWDWTLVAGDDALRARLADAARRFYLHDTECPLRYEPSGHDFLSPCIAEADFMRRVLDAKAYGAWLAKFLPGIPRDGGAKWLAPAIVTNRRDPKLGHLDGLNLSRSWMLEGIARALGPADRRHAALMAAAHEHRAAALPHVTGEHYEGGHWLGTFAVYLVTGTD
jgi:hypothetical protein